MKHALVTLTAIFLFAAGASADCPAPKSYSAFGHTYEGNGLIYGLADAFGDTKKDCDDHKQPDWLATINASAPASSSSSSSSTGTAPGLVYCRQIVQSKDQQYAAQRHDCIYWYGHSIENP